jgi:transposase-like protein
MPSYPHRGHLKAEIVARVAAGETVRGICEAAGMPTKASVQVWRRADPAFAAALAEARPRGAWRRELMFDEAVAAAFLARVAAGERVADLLARPGMPSQRAYRFWRRTDVGFQEALWRLRGHNYARRTGSGHGRWRGWDEAVADRITLAVMRGAVLRRFLASDPALPCLAVVERWRRETPEWDGALRLAMKAGRLARGRAVEPVVGPDGRTARGARARCTPELVEEICDRIVEGGSLRSVAQDPDMPCARTLYAWVAKRPEFERQVLEACRWRDEWLNDQMLEICDRNGPLGLAKTKREVRPLQFRMNQFSKRPGWKRRRKAAAEDRERWGPD